MRRTVLLALACLCIGGGLEAAGPPPVLPAQDRADIEQLYAQYNHLIDQGAAQAEAWAALFTQDGSFNNVASGRDGLTTWMRQRPNALTRRHWNSGLLLTPTSEGARGSIYLIVWDISVSPPVVATMGRYEDVLVKTPGGWRFKSRIIRRDTQPAP